jgi:hypothetical protein
MRSASGGKAQANRKTPATGGPILAPDGGREMDWSISGLERRLTEVGPVRNRLIGRVNWWDW